MEEKIKLILDTDIGSDIDDALCLAYLLQQSRCEIMGITTSSIEAEKRAELADSVCRYVGREIPIYPGLKAPLQGKHLQTKVHQYDVVKNLPHRSDFPVDEAIEFMRRTIEENPREVVLLPVGPMTNVGGLFAKYPHVIPLVKAVSLMGGAFFERGLSYLTTEWNILNDPVAAKIICDSGVRLYVCGLDVTMPLKVSCKEFLDTPRRAKIFEVVKMYATKFLERTDDMYFHDALSAVVLFREDVCRFHVGSVEVDLTNEWGRTNFISDPNGNAMVAYDVDVEKFMEHYYEITEEAAEQRKLV